MEAYDATGIEPTSRGQGKLLPKKWFTFEVIEYTTQDGTHTYPEEGFTKANNYPKVDILTEVVDEGEFKGIRVFHTVTFMPKGKDGAGMAIHWLKSINQPFEGKFTPVPISWVGQRAMGYAIEDEYKGKKKNKWGEIKAIPVDVQAPLVSEGSSKNDEIPF